MRPTTSRMGRAIPHLRLIGTGRRVRTRPPSRHTPGPRAPRTPTHEVRIRVPDELLDLVRQAAPASGRPRGWGSVEQRTHRFVRAHIPRAATLLATGLDPERMEVWVRYRCPGRPWD